jgi:D-sedoheptulose 7-phosphate isomerase
MADVTNFETYRAQTTDLLNQVCTQQIAAACDILEQTYKAGGTVWAIGNGGSASTASHFIEDLAKLMWHSESGRRLKCHALTEASPFLTALANDDGYERIFEIQLAIQSSPKDAVICISGSGQSPNVLRAAQYAKDHDMHAIAFTGFDGGTLKEIAPLQVHVPSHNMGMLEGVHLLVLDYISKELRYRVYGTPHHNR